MNTSHLQSNVNQSKAHIVQNLPTYYQCECGKSYMAFPALYLHFQRKHGARISKHFQLENCVLEDHADYRLATYFFSKIIEKNITQKPKKEYWGILINHYITKEVSRSPEKDNQMGCLESLKNFLEQIEDEVASEFSNSENKQMTYHFNDFMVKKIKELPVALFAKWSETLINFSVWQYKNGYSETIVEKNEKFSIF